MNVKHTDAEKTDGGRSLLCIGYKGILPLPFSAQENNTVIEKVCFLLLLIKTVVYAAQHFELVTGGNLFLLKKSEDFLQYFFVYHAVSAFHITKMGDFKAHSL